MQLNLEDISLKIKHLLKDKEYFNFIHQKHSYTMPKENIIYHIYSTKGV